MRKMWFTTIKTSIESVSAASNANRAWPVRSST